MRECSDSAEHGEDSSFQRGHYNEMEAGVQRRLAVLVAMPSQWMFGNSRRRWLHTTLHGPVATLTSEAAGPAYNRLWPHQIFPPSRKFNRMEATLCYWPLF